MVLVEQIVSTWPGKEKNDFSSLLYLFRYQVDHHPDVFLTSVLILLQACN